MKNEFLETQTATSLIQDKANENVSPGRPTPLTSGLSLSAQAEPPPIYLDAFQLADALRGPCGDQWRKVDLPYDVNGAFQTKTLSLTPEGKFITDRRTLAGSGSAIVRVLHGLPTPVCNRDLKNQLTIEERDRLLKTTPQGSHPASTQFHGLMSKWEKLFDFLEKEFNYVRIGAQTFDWFELYREYDAVGDEHEVHRQLQQVFNRNYGEYSINKDRRGRRSRKNGSLLVYELPIPPSLNCASDTAFANLKMYRKGDKLRIEVSFRYLPVPKFHSGRVGVTASKENAIQYMTEFGERLVKEGAALLDKVHQELFTQVNDLDVAKLRRKLRDDLGMKGVDGQDKCIELMITDLATKGTYTPADHGRLRLGQGRMKTLKNEVYGLLEEVPSPLKKTTHRKTYRLRHDWENVPARPPGNPRKTRMLDAELRKALSKLGLTNEQKSVLAAELGVNIQDTPDDLK